MLKLKQKPLTEEEKIKIWFAIEKKRAFDDKPPEDVIKDSFEGDTEKYLRTMAEWHHVSIG
ncbi:hypothetical protein KJA17_00365 [Patescibacteria group bacterium]|nr:hypothetical protein [Patescibacteria group bacterium]